MKRALAVMALSASLPVVAQTLHLDGEVFAQRSEQIAPPSIPNAWNLSITELAADGAPLELGDVVVVFDGGQTEQQLLDQRGKLAEKHSSREQLLLELAEREKNERLATEERRARLDKAERKATQPEELVRRVDYRKLVIERTEAEELMTLAEQRERLAAEQRRQELRLVDSEITLLERQIDTLEAAMDSLTIRAGRPGILSHKTSWNGEKFAVGSQVFRGQSVAEIPDPTSLAVRTQVDERDLTRGAPGMAARITVEGSGTARAGRVVSIGQVVHSKSRVQPVPVVDLEVALDDSARLKPGQAVRIELFTSSVARQDP